MSAKPTATSTKLGACATIKTPQVKNWKRKINLLLYLAILGVIFFSSFLIPQNLDTQTANLIVVGISFLFVFVAYLAGTGWFGNTGERALTATLETLDTMKARQRRDSIAQSVIHHTQREDETPRKL